MRLSVW